MFATRALRMQPTSMLKIQPAGALRMQPTRQLLRAVPKEEHSAHTVSQRLRTLKKIPVELLPLGAVLVVAVGAAFYSLGRKLTHDKTLRLWKTPKQSEH